MKLGLESGILLILFAVGLLMGWLSGHVDTKPTPEPKPEPKPEPTQPNRPDISNDCANALVALGYKKKESKRLVKDFFENSCAENVTEFMTKFHEK